MTTYYVDATLGNDSSADPTNIATPWQTIAKVNSTLTGDQSDTNVLFKKGETWREQLTVPGSGTSGHPFTFGAYGSGEKPVISGADVITDFSMAGGGGSATFYPAANTDDVRCAPTACADDNYLIAGYQTSVTKDFGVRFINVTIPKGATITSAKVTFTAIENQTGTTVNMKVRGELSATPAAFNTTVSAFYNRTRTTASVTWNSVAAWSDNSTYDTPSIISVISEIIALSGWASGDNLVLFVEDNGSTQSGTVCRSASGYNFSSGSEKAALAVEWTAPTYYTKAGITTEPMQVFYDGVRLTPHDGATTGIASGEWDWDSDTLYIKDNPAGHTIEISQRGRSIYLDVKPYITIDGLQLTRANQDNLFAEGSSHLIVKNCLIDYAFRHGIAGWDGSNPQTDFTIGPANEISYNGASGVEASVNSQNWTISYNELHHNCLIESDEDHYYTAAIRGGNTSVEGLLVEHNYIYNNGLSGPTQYTGEGIWLDGDHGGSNDSFQSSNNPSIVRYNLLDGNVGGLMLEYCSYVQVYYNIVINSKNLSDHTQFGIGMYLSRNAHNNKILNNTLYNNRIGISLAGTSPEVEGDMTGNFIQNNIVLASITKALQALRGAENDGTYGSDNIYTYNALDLEVADFVEWGAATPDTYDAWETLYGGTTNSVESDPLFVNAAGGDFRLQSGSPAINAGTAVGLLVDFNGNRLRGNPDIGAFECDLDFNIRGPESLGAKSANYTYEGKD